MFLISSQDFHRGNCLGCLYYSYATGTLYRCSTPMPTSPNDTESINGMVSDYWNIYCEVEIIYIYIDNSGNVLFISRQVRERVIKSSLCVETRPIVGKRVETEYTIRIFNNLVLLLRP